MTALQMVERLKADRLAELAAEEAEAERKEAEEKAAADRLFDEALAGVLEAQGVAWLAQFREGRGVPEVNDRWRSSESGRQYALATFQIPGHRKVQLSLLLKSGTWVYHTDEDDSNNWRAEWIKPGAWHWLPTLADALLAADLAREAEESIPF